MLWIIVYALILAAMVPHGAATTIAAAILCGIPCAILLKLQRERS